NFVQSHRQQLGTGKACDCLACTIYRKKTALKVGSKNEFGGVLKQLAVVFDMAIDLRRHLIEGPAECRQFVIRNHGDSIGIVPLPDVQTGGSNFLYRLENISSGEPKPHGEEKNRQCAREN